jgi:uncharacterized membrane protein SirB2
VLEFYPQIKSVHLACIITNGALFTTRGLLVQLGYMRLARCAALRWLSLAVDTTLLTAALMLLNILPRGMFTHGWLYAKLVLVLAYGLLGVMALRATTPSIRRLGYAGALLAYATIIGIAHAHHPLGWLYLWFA